MVHLAILAVVLTQPKEAAFDLNNPKETLKWLEPDVRAAYALDGSNQLKWKSMEEKLAAKAKSLEGMKVNWLTRIIGVQEQGVGVEGIAFRYPYDTYYKYRKGELKNPPADLHPGIFVSVQYVVPFEDKEWAASLSKGDPVRVVGVISSARHGWEGKIGERTFVIILKFDGKATKP